MILPKVTAAATRSTAPLEAYHQFTKNKCVLVDVLLQNLQYTLNYGTVRAELSAMFKDGLTF